MKYQHGVTEFTINVSNPKRLSSGATEIKVTGNLVRDGLVRYEEHSDSAKVIVDVVLLG